MSKVTIKMQIHSCYASSATGDVWLERGLELPFAPFIGLEVGGKSWSEILREIYFDIDRQEFTCYIESDKEYYNKGLKDGIGFHATPEMMEEKIKDYLEDGWSKEANPT